MAISTLPVEFSDKTKYLRDLFFEEVDCPVWIVNERFELIDFNSEFKNIYIQSHGKAPELGTTVFKDIVNEEAKEEWRKNYVKSLQEKNCIRKVAGKDNVWQATLKPVKTEDGIVIFCTSKKIIIEKEYENGVSLLLSRMPDLVMYDLSKKNRYMSENIFRVTGFTNEEILNSDDLLKSRIHPDDQEKIQLKYHEWIIKGSDDMLTLEYRFRHKLGHQIWIEDRMMSETLEDGSRRVNGFLIDFSTRKGFMEEVRLADEKFRTFMDFNPGMAWIKNENFRYVFCNQAYRDRFSLTPDCENGLITDFDIYDAQFAEHIRVNDEKLIKDGIPQKYIEVLRDPDNGPQYLQVSRFLISGKDGKKLIAGMALDITDQVKDQELIRQNEELYKVLTIGIRDMVSVHNEKSEFTFVSPSSQSVVSYNTDEIIGKAFFDFIHPDDKKRIKEDYQQALDGHDDKRLEYRFRKKDGSYVWVESLLTLVYDESNHYTGFYASTRDISERKLGEERQGIQHQLVSDILDMLPSSLFVKDKEKRIIFTNRTFSSIFGIPGTDMLMRKFSEVDNAPPELKTFEETDDKVLKSQNELTKNETITLQNGKQSHLHTVRKKVKLSDGSTHIIGIATDITRIIESERNIKAAHDEMKNFIYKASHDLKGPLSSILGLSNLAQHTIEDKESLKYFNMIGERTTTLTTLLDDLLRVAHVTSEKVVLEYIDFKEIVNSIIKEHQYQKEFSGLEVKIFDRSTTSFKGNRSMIITIFQNIISNAAKYRHPKRQPVVDINITNKDNIFSITFTDNCKGISKKACSQIFDIFFRADLNCSGSGLGLYIVKKSIERMGGDITLESTPGKGSCFTVNILNNHIN